MNDDVLLHNQNECRNMQSAFTKKDVSIKFKLFQTKKYETEHCLLIERVESLQNVNQ